MLLMYQASNRSKKIERERERDFFFDRCSVTTGTLKGFAEKSHQLEQKKMIRDVATGTIVLEGELEKRAHKKLWGSQYGWRKRKALLTTVRIAFSVSMF